MRSLLDLRAASARLRWLPQQGFPLGKRVPIDLDGAQPAPVRQHEFRAASAQTGTPQRRDADCGNRADCGRQYGRLEAGTTKWPNALLYERLVQ